MNKTVLETNNSMVSTDKNDPPPGFSPTHTVSDTSDADINLDTCFSFDLKQGREDRHWPQIDGLKDVPGLVREQKFDRAMAILNDKEALFHDFDFIYAWKAHIFQKKGDFNAAGKTLTTGLQKANTKYLLCDRFGFLESSAGRMQEAVQWWIRSIVLMSNETQAGLWEPFLYLAHIARTVGCETEHALLVNAANTACRQGNVELKPEAANSLERQSAGLEKTWVPQALVRLCNTWLPDMPSPAPVSCKDPETTEQLSENTGEGIRLETAEPKPGRLPYLNNRKMVRRIIALAFVISAICLCILLYRQASVTVPEKQGSPAVEKTPIQRPSSAPQETSGQKNQQEAPAITPKTTGNKKAGAQTEPPQGPVSSDPGVQDPLETISRGAAEQVPYKQRPSYIKQKTKQPEARLKKKSPGPSG